jgi:exodeoxyribonuclease VII large subunit
LDNSVQNLLQRQGMRVEQLASKIPAPGQQIQNAQERLLGRTQSLMSAYQSLLQRKHSQYDRTSALVRRKAVDDSIQRSTQKLSSLSALLESYSYKSVLDRGFALVTDNEGSAVTSPTGLNIGQELSIQFGGDNKLDVLVNGEGVAPTATPTPQRVAPKPKQKPKAAPRKKSPSPEQGSLF